VTDLSSVELVETLGLPGIFDVHTHFLPPRVMAKVWEQFDTAGPLIGRPWPITYRGTDEERVQVLRGLGVRRFSTLPYAHRPGIAEWLNDWAADFSDRVPEALRCATLFPEPEAAAYVGERIAAGTELFKVHVQVGHFDLRDPLLDRVWAQLAEAGTPVVVHAGSGPVGNEHTGPTPLREVLERHPRLCVIVAHLGAPEYEGFLDLLHVGERVHLDTTMAFTDFFPELGGAFPEALLPRLVEAGDRILHGSDFPNIPYPYEHQLESLVRLELGDDWLRGVLWGNAVRLFGEPV